MRRRALLAASSAGGGGGGEFYCYCDSVGIISNRTFTFKLKDSHLWGNYIGEYDITNSAYISETNIGITIIIYDGLGELWYPVEGGSISPNDTIIAGNTYYCPEFA